MTLAAYTDLTTFRQFIRTDTSDTTDEALETLALETAARAIEQACGRTFTAALTVAAPRYFTSNVTRSVPVDYGIPVFTWQRHYTLPIHDVSSATDMVVKFDTTGNGDYTTTTTDYRLGPTNAPARSMPYSILIFDSGIYPPTWEEGVEVTAKWGWSAIPSTIIEANLIQAARFLKRRDAVFGIAGSPDMGNELRLLSKLDPDVALMVNAYTKRWGAA
jgi:hypothetical protein